MIHELRTYRLASGPMLRHMHNRMERHMMPLFAEHGMRVAGAWETVVGREMPCFHYMLQFDDMGERQRRFDAFYADPRVEQMRTATVEEAGGEFLRDYDIALLRPAPYLEWRLPR